jgi:hypothetical protein
MQPPGLNMLSHQQFLVSRPPQEQNDLSRVVQAFVGLIELTVHQPVVSRPTIIA